jgi:hypothetical protein
LLENNNAIAYGAAPSVGDRVAGAVAH